MASAALPLALVLTLTLGCTALLAFTLYRYRAPKPDATSTRLKPLFLSALSRKKDTLPREFYGLPPRNSISVAPRPSGIGSRLGLGPVLRWGSSLPAGEGRAGAASLPHVKASGLPGLDNSFEDAGVDSAASKANTPPAILGSLSISTILALIVASISLAGAGGQSRWRHLALAVTVCSIPWSAFAVGALQRCKPTMPASSTCAVVLGAGISVVVGCIAAAVSPWVIVAGSIVPLLATTAAVLAEAELPQRCYRVLHSRVARIRLSTDRLVPSTGHRRNKVSDRLFHREKERSFFSGPGATGSLSSPARGLDGDDILGTSRRDSETTRDYILRAQRERDSWLESPSEY